MLNVKTLTDTMSRMELPQLQQYATLHKNDPYIVTLALSIANQKKQMKAGQAGQAGMQPQPKVADQQIAQMVAPRPAMAAAPQQEAPAVDAMGNVTGYAGGGYLPEDQGIGQLPAPNMQGMAAGGIVAFGPGGSTEEENPYTGDTYTDDPAEMARRKLLAQQRAQTQAQDQRPAVGVNANDLLNTGQTDSSTSSPLGRLFTLTPEQQRQAAVLQAYRRKQAEMKQLGGSFGLKSQTPEQKAAFDRVTAEAEYLQKLIDNPKAVPPAGSPLTTAVQPSVAPPVAPAAPVVGQDGSQPPVSGAAAPAAVAAPSAEDDYMAGVDKLFKSSQTASNMGPMTKLDAKRYSFTPEQLSNLTPADYAAAVESAMPKNPTASPFDAQQTELNKANTATRQNTKKELEQQFEKQGLAFKETLEKLTSKENRVKTMEDNQLGMSMFEAGLAMMAGESPYAMVNIGKGAQVGTKKYMEIQEKIEGARDKIDDAKMKIEEFRRNEANMNARELRAAQRDIDDSVSAGAQSMLNLAREQYGLNKQQALSFFTNSQLAQQFNAGEKNKAAAQNQQTAAGIDTAYAQMANQRSINTDNKNTQLGLAKLEAKYRAANPAAGSLGFFRELGKGDPVKGMEVYSRSLGPEGKGSEAILLDWQKKDPFEKDIERKKDPMGSAQKDRLLRERLLQGSVSDKPAGSVLDQPR